MKLMKAIGDTTGFIYLVFLQPTLGVGDYNPSAEDDRVKAEADENYYEGINKVYQELRPRCKSLPYCVDLVDAFRGQSNLFSDPRHSNARGNRVLAEKIFRELVMRLKEK